MTTRLIAAEKFFYSGRNVEKGEEFDAEDQDVFFLTHHHTPKATTIELEPQKKKVEAPERSEKEAKQNYKRRDMKAAEN